MIDFAELHQQQHRIGELSHVLLYLVRNRSLCDADTTCGLFFDYVESARAHLRRVDALVKKHLLTHADPWSRHLARRLITDAALLDRNLVLLLERWSLPARRSLRITDHAAFIADAEELFLLVADRIQRETEYLFPLLRGLGGGDQRAA